MRNKIFNVILFTIALLVIGSFALPAFAQNVACYTEQGGAKVVAGLLGATGCEHEFQSGSTLDVQSGSTTTFANNPSFTGNPTFAGDPAFTGSMTVAGITSTASIYQSNGDLTVADNLIVTPQTVISPTDGGVVTTTGTYQKLSSAGTVTVTIETASVTTGTHVTLENTTDTTIRILNTGTTKLAGDIDLGQYDTLTVRFDGTNWIEDSRSNNTPTAGLVVASATFAIAAQGGNSITATIQYLDVDGDEMTVAATVPFYLSSDAVGLDPAAAPDAGIAIVTDGALIEWTANASGLAISEADGDLAIELQDTGSGTWYIVLVMPNGSLVVSGAITFA